MLQLHYITQFDLKSTSFCFVLFDWNSLNSPNTWHYLTMPITLIKYPNIMVSKFYAIIFIICFISMNLPFFFCLSLHNNGRP